MPGETDIDVMLAGLDPRLDPTEFVFATVSGDVALPVHDVAVRVWEDEGITLVLPAATARSRGLRHDFPCRRITLRIHSALAAVGLTAAVADALAAEGLPANVVAGFHHDHLFVPADRADLARDVLVDLTGPPSIRPARPDDEAHLWAMLHHAAWAGSEEEPATDPYLRRYVEAWGRAGDLGVVACGPSGRVVGAAWIRPLDDAVPELAIATVPSQRGRGVGGRLLTRLVEHAAGEGIGTIRLDVRPTNPAVRLYERLGFVETGTTTNRLGETSIVMERRLGDYA